MKELMCNLPTLATPVPGEDILLYLSASKTTISAIMMVERLGKQIPIYFISITLKGPEKRYPPMEKLTLSLIFASRKLRRYFEAHKVVLLTDQPLQKVLRRPELSGRLVKWEVELGYHAIEYKTRTSVKGQFYTNGASSEKGNGAVITLISPEGIELTYAIKLDFENTNNTTEYEALLDGLRQAKKVKARNNEANSNSQLVVKQYNGEYDAKDDTMAQYMTQVKELAKTFNTFKMEYVPQGKNRKENVLSKLASVAFDHLAREVKVEVLPSPSISYKEASYVEKTGESWITRIIEFLSEGTPPEDEALSKKIWEKALQYEIIDGPLFRRSYLGPCLKCVDEEEAKYVIQEIHEGIRGMYSGPKTVVAKAMNAWFY
ncbi:uncharacterized protein LOC110901694 [Helianthus annuus]|uniref:uncharacterized protein LOC110901694 n=1 Tax=Helianthus annuus TaxID=4232 RepID=UPI000B8F8FE8|nr:uncharacterized protein LOC110901694 [Helianthus annuus]